MDDFLGTSIQYSELQILRLEKEYAAKQEKIVEELISSGFLDSDYDESTENESTETEFTDNENESFEIVDDNKYTDSPIIESLNDLNMMISPKSLNGPNDSSSSPTPTPSDVIITSPSNNNNNNNNNNNILVLASDISVVDESIVSNSESINDALQPRIIFEEEKINQEDEQVHDIQEYDIITSKAIIRLMEFVFSDVKYLMILFILMVAMPIFEQQQQQQQEQQQMNDRFEMYGGVHYNNYKRCGGQQSQESEYLYETSINFYMEPMSKTQAIINEEDDEKDEYQDNDDNKNQCKNHQQHILSFDIMTTAFDLNTKKLRSARLSHHEFKINPYDLLSTCNNNNDDNINNNDNDDNNNNMNMRNWRMRIRENIPIPHDMPRLFLMATNGVKPQMMRIFKETMSDTVGSQFGRSHGLYAMVMAFVGIAGFAAANGVDELITIS